MAFLIQLQLKAKKSFVVVYNNAEYNILLRQNMIYPLVENNFVCWDNVLSLRIYKIKLSVPLVFDFKKQMTTQYDLDLLYVLRFLVTFSFNCSEQFLKRVLLTIISLLHFRKYFLLMIMFTTQVFKFLFNLVFSKQEVVCDFAGA